MQIGVRNDREEKPNTNVLNFALGLQWSDVHNEGKEQDSGILHRCKIMPLPTGLNRFLGRECE
jgi:hypothetical protein